MSVLKLLISALSDTLESKNLTIDERNLTSTQWVEYNNGTKRTLYNSLPMSDITAEAVSVDALVLSQTDNAGVITTSPSPLAIQKDGTWHTYGWDLTKNICELYGSNGYIRTEYTYSPYGEVTESGDTRQPIQWSSEYHDTELGLVYYNYRHYNPMEGRWLGRDRGESANYPLIYDFLINNPLIHIDVKGNDAITILILLAALCGLSSCSSDSTKPTLAPFEIKKMKYCFGYALPLKKEHIDVNLNDLVEEVAENSSDSILNEKLKKAVQKITKWADRYTAISSTSLSFSGYMLYACVCPKNEKLNYVAIEDFGDTDNRMMFDYMNNYVYGNKDFELYAYNFLSRKDSDFEHICDSDEC